MAGNRQQSSFEVEAYDAGQTAYHIIQTAALVYFQYLHLPSKFQHSLSAVTLTTLLYDHTASQVKLGES